MISWQPPRQRRGIKECFFLSNVDEDEIQLTTIVSRCVAIFWEKNFNDSPRPHTSAPLKSHHVFLQAKFEGAYGKASWFTEEEDLGSGLFRQALVWRLAGLWFLIIKGVWWCLSEVSMKLNSLQQKKDIQPNVSLFWVQSPFSTKTLRNMAPTQILGKF